MAGRLDVALLERAGKKRGEKRARRSFVFHSFYNLRAIDSGDCERARQGFILTLPYEEERNARIVRAMRTRDKTPVPR